MMDNYAQNLRGLRTAVFDVRRVMVQHTADIIALVMLSD